MTTAYKPARTEPAGTWWPPAQGRLILPGTAARRATTRGHCALRPRPIAPGQRIAGLAAMPGQTARVQCMALPGVRARKFPARPPGIRDAGTPHDTTRAAPGTHTTTPPPRHRDQHTAHARKKL